ncbi:YtxH domain-containing protein [Ornithinicoccus hortensis]|uniref:YtxH domain-containing protein n=1 Tax=Ornithinicoccus hortensis TaxID=82346 RepID=A0A542YNF9_9MICO|nr:YtxH domain-containing protein [Ornithinicoccus hortensis]TQL49638.1 hypothetical protein FB467_0714 [Ornithinicoccus hortensis]
MKKILLLVGVGIGYILGAKAGRERYDQIAGKANEVWGNPKVQEKVEEVKAQAPEVAQKVGDVAKDAASQAKSKVTGHEATGVDGSYENATGAVDGSTGDTVVDTTGFGPGGDKLP